MCTWLAMVFLVSTNMCRISRGIIIFFIYTESLRIKPKVLYNYFGQCLQVAPTTFNIFHILSYIAFFEIL